MVYGCVCVCVFERWGMEDCAMAVVLQFIVGVCLSPYEKLSVATLDLLREAIKLQLALHYCHGNGV